jgi:hypothetical protein
MVSESQDQTVRDGSCLFHFNRTAIDAVGAIDATTELLILGA